MALDIRIGASKYDSAEILEAYERIRPIVHELGFGGYLRESAIVTLIETYGVEKTERGIRDMYNRRNHSWNTLVGLIEGRIPAERSAPQSQQAKVNERPVDRSGRSGSGPRSATDFLADHPQKIEKPQIKGRIPEGLMTVAQVNDWLTVNGVAITRADEFFSFAGVGTNGANYWTLLPEHLRPKNEITN